MIVSLPGETLLSALGWMLVGLVVYFTYGRINSKLQKGHVVSPKDPVDPLNPR
jgi:hypothetical protein